mmetsp:Transcript_42261/g.126686  ORF Transcript_42261/g.126686 Transcript_42261/m.126686 type:complete len:245 (-) Transcript_42261:83-817(-)
MAGGRRRAVAGMQRPRGKAARPGAHVSAGVPRRGRCQDASVVSGRRLGQPVQDQSRVHTRGVRPDGYSILQATQGHLGSFHGGRLWRQLAGKPGLARRVVQASAAAPWRLRQRRRRRLLPAWQRGRHVQGNLSRLWRLIGQRQKRSSRHRSSVSRTCSSAWNPNRMAGPPRRRQRQRQPQRLPPAWQHRRHVCVSWSRRSRLSRRLLRRPSRLAGIVKQSCSRGWTTCPKGCPPRRRPRPQRPR